jgi:predicted short-subunit dehydrogenase-like oxidoreductase (DUF2520 family)
MEVVIIGSGNVATHLGLALKDKGVTIKQVFSKNPVNAEALAAKLDTTSTSDIAKIYNNADVYFYALKDSALRSILRKIKMPAGIQVHTGGTIPMSEFEGFTARFGVFYPLQTFTIDKPVDFANIPICIEASNLDVQNTLLELASLISSKHYLIDSQRRKKLHLAAVFACNFTNYMYDISSEILAEAGIDFEIMYPLIDETTEKIKTLTPFYAQTGPAVRMDTKTISKHLNLLSNKSNFKVIYKLLTKEINIRHSPKSSSRRLTSLLSYITKK